MPYLVIAGEFHIRYPDLPRNGPEPDGDTLKFKPHNPLVVEALHRNGGRGPDFNGRGMVNIRFEGIDALETHFEVSHQELAGANAARDFVLAEVGFQNVTFFDDLVNKVRSADVDALPGYVIANGIDPHGRVIGFAYPGAPPETDGTSIMLMSPRVSQSINARLLEAGLAYPTFYTSLPIDLKDGLRDIARQARAAGNGLWPRAVGGPGEPVAIAGLAQAETLVLWPKLFRRLVRYFGEGHIGFGAFDSWLRSDPVNRDDSILLPNRELGNMHDVISINTLNDTLEMNFEPEDLIIVPDGMLPIIPPRPVPRISAGDVRIVVAFANPLGADAGGETVTLLNASPGEVTLDGWEIVDLASRRHVLAGALQAGHTSLIALTNVQLNNTGDTIILRDGGGTVVDQVSFTGPEASRQGWSIVFGR